MTKCKKCKQEMDEESQDFYEEYEVDWCLNCIGEDLETNAKEGTFHHLSIPVYKESS